MRKTNTFFRYKKKIPVIKWVIGILLLLILAVIGIFGRKYITLPTYTANLVEKKLEQKEPPPTPHPYPVNKTGIYPNSNVGAESIVVLDVDSHMYLYKRNDQMPLFPASTTKIMTALVALDTYNLDDIVTVGMTSASGQMIGLVPGEKMTVENLLYGALIHSGNDAAQALADFYPGGANAFIEKMNEKAKSLHMDQSRFTNPAGYDNSGHKVTAMDLSILAKAAIQNKIIAKMVAIPSISISDVTHTYFHKLTNVNQLLGKIPGVAGIKTGWTEAAGENLVTFVERDGHRVIFVVLHSRDRFGDTTKLIDWVFTNYRWEDMDRKD